MFYNDEVHPGGLTGARVMGEMAAAWILDAALDLGPSATLLDVARQPEGSGAIEVRLEISLRQTLDKFYEVLV